MKPFEYISITGNTPLPEMEIADVSGFIQLAQTLEAPAIFTRKGEGGDAMEWFSFVHDRMVYKVRAGGFRTLEDSLEADKAGFPDSESFYDARSHNIRTFREYEDVSKAGASDKELYAKAQKTGFVDNFTRFRQRLAKELSSVPEDSGIENIGTAVQLFEYAMERGYKDYGDFVVAFFAGYDNDTEWKDAREKGFTDSGKYKEAMKMGLSSSEEYEEASEKGITSKAEFDKYMFLKNMSRDIYAFDQVILINALKRYENGKKLSINKLKDLLKSQQDEYFGNGEVKIPNWYTTRLKTNDDYATLLMNNPDLRDHGKYDPDGEYFEVKRVLDNTVVVDGSNVAFGNTGRRGQFAKARFANVLSIVKQLKSSGYKKIIVISDASLWHRVLDKDVKDDILKEKVTYKEAPSQTDADRFILDLAKKENCYVVSNDLFRDHKKNDEWVKENIDRLRVPFMIVNGMASLLIKE